MFVLWRNSLLFSCIEKVRLVRLQKRQSVFKLLFERKSVRVKNSFVPAKEEVNGFMFFSSEMASL